MSSPSVCAEQKVFGLISMPMLRPIDDGQGGLYQSRRTRWDRKNVHEREGAVGEHVALMAASN